MSSNNSNNNGGLSLKSKLQSAIRTLITAISCHPDGTVNRRILNLADIKTPPSSTPINGVSTSDHAVCHLRFRLFLPSSATPSAVIVYFHGGGFVSFSPSTAPFDALCRRLAGETNAVVVSVDYRLAPENKWPAQYEDGFDVLRFLDDETERVKIEGFPVGLDLGRCFLAGDSAGGNVAHHVAVRVAKCQDEFKVVRVRGLVAIQPFFGGNERTESELKLVKSARMTLDRTDFFWKAFLPSGTDRDHPASNVIGPRSEDIAGLKFPPTLVVVGGLDLLQDWQKRYCDWLRRSGKEVELVEYPDVHHGFYSAPELNEYSLLVARVGEFMHKHLDNIESFTS